MGEQGFFLAGGIFLSALAIGLLRYGGRQGGVAWFAAWACFYLSGASASLSAEFSVFLPLVPAFGTASAALLLVGSFQYTRRSSEFPKIIGFIALAIAIARIVAQYSFGEGVSQLLGAVVISVGVGASSWVLLRPGDRPADAWARGLGFSFPAIAVASLIYAYSKLAGLPIASGQFVWLVIGIALCVLKVSAFLARTTEEMQRLRLEADRSRDAQARVEAQYREVTENASDLICEVDERGNYLYANPAHKALLGYEQSELIGSGGDDLIERTDLKDERTDFAESVWGEPHQRHIVFRCRDGTLRHLECNFHPFLHSTGERRLVVTGRDITDRLALERVREEGREKLEALVEDRTAALRSSLEELQRSQRLASVGTLAAGIAHQINNPVGSIQMSAEFGLAASESVDDSDVTREALENCRDQAIRCGRIVSNMLQFARNEPTAKAEEDLAQILRRVCEQMETYAVKRNASINATAISGPLMMIGSAIDLEQAFLNILRNAAESSDSSVTISVDAHREKDRILVRVSDDGRGMDREASERIFDPFFTTRLGSGGTGLGLSVAHGVVADHKGNLSVKSEVGRGTEIRISFPIAEPVLDFSN